jgi:hypothetical protein
VVRVVFRRASAVAGRAVSVSSCNFRHLKLFRLAFRHNQQPRSIRNRINLHPQSLNV